MNAAVEYHFTFHKRQTLIVIILFVDLCCAREYFAHNGDLTIAGEGLHLRPLRRDLYRAMPAMASVLNFVVLSDRPP